VFCSVSDDPIPSPFLFPRRCFRLRPFQRRGLCRTSCPYLMPSVPKTSVQCSVSSRSRSRPIGKTRAQAYTYTIDPFTHPVHSTRVLATFRYDPTAHPWAEAAMRLHVLTVVRSTIRYFAKNQTTLSFLTCLSGEALSCICMCIRTSQVCNYEFHSKDLHTRVRPHLRSDPNSTPHNIQEKERKKHKYITSTTDQ
jgi:hypothetical protein